MEKKMIAEKLQMALLVLLDDAEKRGFNPPVPTEATTLIEDVIAYCEGRYVPSDAMIFKSGTETDMYFVYSMSCFPMWGPEVDENNPIRLIHWLRLNLGMSLREAKNVWDTLIAEIRMGIRSFPTTPQEIMLLLTSCLAHIPFSSNDVRIEAGDHVYVLETGHTAGILNARRLVELHILPEVTAYAA